MHSPAESYRKDNRIIKQILFRPPNLKEPNNVNIDFSDDSLRYEYPFTLKLVLRDGSWCSQCQWHRFCRGCALPCSGDDLFVDSPSSHLAIDWDQTALHLRWLKGRQIQIWITKG